MIRTRKSRTDAPAGGFSSFARRLTRWVRSIASWTLTSAWRSARWMSRTTSPTSASSIVPLPAIFWRTPRSDFPSASRTIDDSEAAPGLIGRGDPERRPERGPGRRDRATAPHARATFLSRPAARFVADHGRRRRAPHPGPAAEAEPGPGRHSRRAGRRPLDELRRDPARVLEGGRDPRSEAVHPVPPAVVRRGVPDLPGRPRVHPADRRRRFRR